MIPSIEEIDVQGKRVLVRIDINVEIDERGEIRDAYRMEAVRPTIAYLRSRGAILILLAHLGDPKTVDKSYSLARLREGMTSFLGINPVFVKDFTTPEGKKTLQSLMPGDVALLENIRFWPGEKANDQAFARALALLGDIYVNDAFSVSHRAHASVAAITKFLPSYAGLLFKKEHEGLERVLKRTVRPFTVILGGAKSSLKLQFLETFLLKADNILLGGILANALLQAQGIAVGRSRVDEAMLREVKNLPLTSTKLHLPVDVRVAKAKDSDRVRTCAVGNVEDDEFIYDIGPETAMLFSRIIRESREVLWNGPMGVIEQDEFAAGTESVARTIAETPAYSVVGGGESLLALHKFNLFTKISHVSTAGGAMLEFLAGESLPGVVALEHAARVCPHILGGNPP